jgi:dihydroneopterin aldolase
VWDALRSYQCVALRDVALAVRLGVAAEEQGIVQPVRVDVELYRRRSAVAAAGTAGDDYLDYDRLFRRLIEDWPRRPHTGLLEDLAEDLVRFCLEDGRVEACRVVVRKPSIYAGRATPAVELYRRRDG